MTSTNRSETFPVPRLSGRVIALLTGGQGRPATIVVLLLATLSYLWWGEHAWAPLRHMVFDAYQRHFPRQADDNWPVVIVDIDQASINALGQWPWPRTRLQRLITATRQAGAQVVGLDIVMPKADRLSPGEFATITAMERQDLHPEVKKALTGMPSNDALLAKVLRNEPVVVGRAALASQDTGSVPTDSQTPCQAVFHAKTATVIRASTGRQIACKEVSQGAPPAAQIPAYGGHLTNIYEIEDAARAHGYLNSRPDPDGIVRRMPLLVRVNGHLAPTLALEILRLAYGANWYTVHSGPTGIRGIQLTPTFTPESFIPTEPDGRLRLFFSLAYEGRYISALSLLNGEAPPGALTNKMVIIGVTGVGLADVIATPVDPRMDGVVVQAQVIENILAKTRLLRPAWVPWFELLLVFVMASALIIFLPLLKPVYGVGIFVLTATLVMGLSLLSFTQARLLIDPGLPIAGNTLALVVLLTAGFAAADQQRRQLNAELEAAKMERERIAGELKAARDIQMGILPKPGDIPGLPGNIALYALLEPAEEVGGDLYDAFMLDAHHLFFMVGDVSGKGLPASLFMALSLALCRSIALRQPAPLETVMQEVNGEIARENPTAYFVTAVAGVLDTQSGTLVLCNAGHDAPILLRAGEPPQSLISIGGLPLCFMEDFPYRAEPIQLQSGDTLVLFTDGVTEAHNQTQNLYSLQRVINFLATQPPQSDVMALCRSLYDDVRRFADKAEPFDDVTIMTLRYTANTT